MNLVLRTARLPEYGSDKEQWMASQAIGEIRCERYPIGISSERFARCTVPVQTKKDTPFWRVLFHVIWLPDLDSNQGPAD